MLETFPLHPPQFCFNRRKELGKNRVFPTPNTMFDFAVVRGEFGEPPDPSCVHFLFIFLGFFLAK